MVSVHKGAIPVALKFGQTRNEFLLVPINNDAVVLNVKKGVEKGA